MEASRQPKRGTNSNGRTAGRPSPLGLPLTSGANPSSSAPVVGPGCPTFAGAPRRHETCRPCETRRPETPRDAPRRHQRPPRHPRDLGFTLIFVIFTRFSSHTLLLFAALLLTTVSDTILDNFWQQNTQTRKMKKCIRTCKIRTILKVGMFTKTCSTPTQLDEKQTIFALKIPAKLNEKSI